MKSFFFIFFLGLNAFFFFLTLAAAQPQPPNSDAFIRLDTVFPSPDSIQKGNGFLKANAGFYVLAAPPIFTPPLEKRLDTLTHPLGLIWKRKPFQQAVPLKFTPAPNLGTEAYILTISPSGLEIQASSESGFFYGLVTLEQLLPEKGEKIDLPFCTIKDHPRFTWRGLMVDSSRHFQTVDKLKDILEKMALHKMNRFHWHLTDDQGWRLEIPSLPQLTRVGAWRKEANGQVYGGFYTVKEVVDLITFAAERQITIIPEIDIPGHSWAALASYPELSATGKETEVPHDWAVSDGVLCLGKKSVEKFLNTVSDQVFALFPGPWVHWGGDEVYRHPWLRNSESLAWMQENKISTNLEVEAKVWNSLAEKTLKAGKIPLGWEEVYQYSPDPKVMVQWWDDPDVALLALKKGYPVIASWKIFSYLDYPEAAWDPDRQDWMVPLDGLQVSQFPFYPKGITLDQKKNLVGLEACLWTEHAPQEKIDRKLFPRLAIFAELAWKGGCTSDFLTRLGPHRRRLESWGVGMDESLR